MEIDIQSAILLFGFVQGVSLILICFVRRRDHRLTYQLFAGVISIFCLSIIDTLLSEFIDFSQLSPSQRFQLTALPLEPIMLLGPLIYFYLRSLFSASFVLNKVHKMHFLPVIIDLFPFLISLWIVVSPGVFSVIERGGLAEGYFTFVAIPQFLSLTFYLYKSYWFLRRMRGEADVRTYRWARDVWTGIAIVDLIWLPFVVLFVSPWQETLLRWVYYFPIYYPVVGLMYFLSVRLMISNSSFRQNLLSRSDLQQRLTMLNTLIETNRLYAKPDIKLSGLSRESGVPAKTISFILNHHLQKGFNEYINEFRVNDAIRRIEAGEAREKTLEGISYEVGFRSRSTFYRSFKGMTGQHPTAFMESS